MENEKIYTLQEVADILRINKQTLYNNIRRGKLKVPKFGKEYRVTESLLQDLLTNGYGNKK